MTMKSRLEKANSFKLELFCLKCKGTQFEYEDGIDHYKCGFCGAEFKQDELEKPAFEKQRPQIEEDATNAVANEINIMLKKTLGKNYTK